MSTPIPSLPGSPTHEVATALYQSHHDAAGACVRCGQRAPCPVRTHAATVIIAAGEDPRWYDERLARRRANRSNVDETYADHTGISITGRNAPIDPAHYLYERDQ